MSMKNLERKKLELLHAEDFEFSFNRLIDPENCFSQEVGYLKMLKILKQ